MSSAERPDARRVLSRLSTTLPAEVVPLIERSGRGQVARAGRSATVVLVRDDGAGLSVYLLHRHSDMPFAAGTVVFPGGRAEPDETAVDCAVRETLEETGVTLSPGELLPWAHWITPEFERRRYDTQFFVAKLPDGATPEDVSGETDRADWERPADALADVAAGKIGMQPPTESVLLELADLSGWAEVQAATQDRLISPVLPRVIRRDGAWVYAYEVAATVEPW